MSSTSECYGDPAVSPQPETYWGNVNPIGPRGVYDEAKRFAEAMVMAYHRAQGVDTHIVRIFNTYGPRMRLNDGRALPNFVHQALTGQPITVYGDGQADAQLLLRLRFDRRNLPPDDVRRARAHQHRQSARNHDSRIRRAHSRLARQSQVPIVFKPLPQDDPKQRCPDISKARRLLGWEPKVDLAEGLEKTLAYFRAQFAAVR